jgi:hypothetical protein
LPLCDILNRVSEPFGRVLGYVVDVGAVLFSSLGIDGRKRVLSRKMARSTFFLTNVQYMEEGKIMMF